jgi:hypothetical protein
VRDLRNLLTGVRENLLLAIQREFYLLSLHFADLNPILSTFMIHMMTHNTCFQRRKSIWPTAFRKWSK